MHTRRSARCLLPLVLALLVVAAPRLVSAGDRWLPTLTGTWVFSTVFGPGLTLPGMVTFHADGTLVYSDATMFGGAPGFPTEVGPFHGVWRQTGRNAFGGTSIGLVFDPLTHAVTGFARARSSLRFDPSRARVVGRLFLEVAWCPHQLTCPDPTDPTVQWAPLGDPVNGFEVSLSRVTRVPAGPLQQ